MNILEWIGFIVTIAASVGAILWAAGVLKMEFNISKEDK